MPSESSFGSSDYSQTQLTAKVRWSSTLARLARLLTEQGYPEDSSRRHLRYHCRPQLAAQGQENISQLGRLRERAVLSAVSGCVNPRKNGGESMNATPAPEGTTV